jgi:pectinesterase
MRRQTINYIIGLLLLLSGVFYAADQRYIVVAQDGSGDYKTITAAISSLPMFNYARTVIYIKNGIYNEKFRIEQDYITFRGESREKTIIKYTQLRTDWMANKDSVGPGVINIFADDIVIENLTIENTQPQIGPHAFVIYGFGTRTILLNCSLISKGGDTVSLWDYKTGMYYHANCYFKGAVDFVCPRGWCFIRDSQFYEVLKTASIWHAGSYDASQKLVIKNSSFDGVKGFELGRHHYEAQFYLIDCGFSDSMSSRPIYRMYNPKEPQKYRAANWGDKEYYFNCHRKAGELDWFKNNLSEVKPAIKPEEITPAWTFGGKWDPESKTGPKIVSYKIAADSLYLTLSENVTVIGQPKLKSKSSKVFSYFSGNENNTMRFVAASKIGIKDLAGLEIINDAKVLATTASVYERKADFSIKQK